MSELRNTLKAAVVKVQDLAAEIEKMEAAVGRAEQTAQEAGSELEQYADLDSAITAWRVDQVKKGLSTKELAPDLKQLIDAKRAAQQELSQAESTVEALGVELADLRRRLKPLENARIQAAVAVLHEHGEGLVSELNGINARRGELIQLLLALGQIEIEVNGRREHIGYPNGTREAVDNPDAPFPMNKNPISDCSGRWQKRLEALLQDADAAITTPKPIAPGDYSFHTPPWEGPGTPWPQTVCGLLPETPELSSCAS
jgi:hypothetical protein